MDKYRQQSNRVYQRTNYRNYARQNSSCGYNSDANYAWDDTMSLKCKCDCDCALTKGAYADEMQVSEACPVPCDCPAVDQDPMRGFPLAMAYVPWQKCKDMYDVCEALYHGTAFPVLDLDFYGKRC